MIAVVLCHLMKSMMMAMDYVECTIWRWVGMVDNSNCDDDPTTGFLTHPDIATNETDPTICYRDNDLDGW